MIGTNIPLSAYVLTFIIGINISFKAISGYNYSFYTIYCYGSIKMDSIHRGRSRMVAAGGQS